MELGTCVGVSLLGVRHSYKSELRIKISGFSCDLNQTADHLHSEIDFLLVLFFFKCVSLKKRSNFTEQHQSNQEELSLLLPSC